MPRHGHADRALEGRPELGAQLRGGGVRAHAAHLHAGDGHLLCDQVIARRVIAVVTHGEYDEQRRGDHGNQWNALPEHGDHFYLPIETPAKLGHQM